MAGAWKAIVHGVSMQRSFLFTQSLSPEEGNGNPLQYSCLENPMDRGPWQATIHGVTKIRT